MLLGVRGAATAEVKQGKDILFGFNKTTLLKYRYSRVWRPQSGVSVSF